MPANLKTIGNSSFHQCNSLTDVHFEENCQVSTFGDKAFDNCNALVNVELENCTAEQITFAHSGYTGAFSNCNSLKKVTVPKGASGDIGCIFRESHSLESITFLENNNEINGIGNIVAETSVKVLDFSPLNGLTDIGAWQVRGNSITKVIFPSSVKSVGQQAVGDMHALTVVEFKPNSELEYIGAQMFQNDDALIAVNLEALSKLQRIGSQAFDGCQNLTSVTFPKTLTTIETYAFNDCKGLIDVKYDAVNLTSVADNIFNGAGYFDLTIGKDVKSIPAGFLAQAQDHISGLKFEGPANFTITGTADLKEPFELGSTYSVDEVGNLYRIDDTGAVLVYANKTEKEITIPEKVGDHIVAGIAKNAFRNSNVTSLKIEKPENITSLEDYAFANAAFLGSINDNNTVDDVKALFTGIDWKDNILYNTAIGKEIKDDPTEEVFPPTGTAEMQPHDTPIEIWRDTNKTLNYSIGSTDKEIKDDVDRKGKYWTGEVANVKFAYVGSHPVRIYIKADKDAKIDLDASGNFLKQTDIEGIYYYDISLEGQSTTGNTLNLSYPNLSAPGSKMQVWAVEFDNETIYNNEFKDNNTVIYPGDTAGTDKYMVENKYYEIEWTTKPNEFTLEKECVSDANVNFIKSDGKTTVSDLKYHITFNKENPEEEDKDIGNDHIRYVDYTDTITLPTKLKWREEISENYTNTRFIKKGDSGTLYITIDGKDHELFTLSNAANLVDMSIKQNGDGTYSLCWRLANTSSTAEISAFDGYITFGSEVIVVDENVKAGDSIGDINNKVYTDEYFTFSGVQEDDAEAKITGFKAPESKLDFNKEVLNDVTRMGEDVQYKITVENPSAFDYTGVDKITDDLNADKQSIHYIKPENMEELFKAEYGDKLTITINNAVLAKELTPTEVNTVVKDHKVNISEQNTAAESDRQYDSFKEHVTDLSVEHDNVTITLKKDSDGNIELRYNAGSVDTVIVIGKDKECPDIASALSQIGYIVTASDSYKLEWDFKDYKFKGGTKIEFDINASLKDSLMYLPEDHYLYYGHPGYPDIYTHNQAALTGASVNLTDTTRAQIIHRDLAIDKGAYVNGKEVNENYQPQDGDVLDYYVKITHDGSGSYDVLPVVDHMTGRQAVIVEVKRNEGAEWVSHAGKTTIDGVDYYVLNQEYTYNGVYTSEFYADSITVKKNDGGLDTLIKYYIENTPGKNFDLDVTYKAITSQELAGNEKTKEHFSIGNEAWLNDRPGHRIYDQIGVSGAAVEIDKKILIGGMKDKPADEEEFLVKELPIKQSANEVTYRLMLHSVGGVKFDEDKNITEIGTELTVNGKDIFDMLPLTGKAFDWSKENISNITYKAGKPGYKKNSDGTFTENAPGKFTYNDVELNGESGGNEWVVKDFDENDPPSEIVKPTDPDDQQYIQWNEKFNVILPPDATVYMYVTLTFPGTDKDTEWDKFLSEKGTDTLFNTFYVYNMPSPVSHTLSDPPSVLLQKGVYETGSYVTKNDEAYLTDQYFSGSDRFHYSNTPEKGDLKNTVTYYVVLRNSGKTNLYLAPIYDILPSGFEYMALRTGDGNGGSWYDVGNTNTANTFSSVPTQNGGKGTILAKPGEDDFSDSDSNFVKAYVKYSYADDSEKHETVDGRQILKFEFYNGPADSNQLQTDNGRYYLKPGQYLQFGYTVYTGNEDITEAVNTVAMQYYDPLKTGISPELDEDTTVKVKDIHSTSPNNDGDRELWTNEMAQKSGFTETLDGYDATAWFASSVTVTRDRISPGIKKTVKEPMIPTGKPAEWTVTSSNNSNSEISGYTITDTLDLPLQFSGKFTYSLYDSENNWYIRAGDNKDTAEGDGNNYLFEMTRNTDGTITVTSNNNDSRTFKLGEGVALPVKIVYNNWSGVGQDLNITLKLTHDDKKHEVLTIGFTDAMWGIVPNGYSVLKFSTPSGAGKDENNKDKIDPGTYTNTAMFSPEDNKYDDIITQGRLVKDDDGNNIGVEHSAVVSIYTGSPSGSVKMIEEKGKIDNFTTSERDDNYISLMDKKNIFTYTLEVQNLDDTKSMDNLVIIDNLPEPDDTTTLRQESKRDSEFRVNLAKDNFGTITPDVQVWLYENAETLNGIADRDKKSPADYKDITYQVLTQGTDYTVEYSDKSNFDEKDWTGENDTSSSRWYDEPKESTRSIRIHFKTVIAKNQAVQIRFDAMIDDEAASSGQIAWNTFGYSYKVGDLTAKASPNKVGICIPGCPTISKKVVNSKGEDSPVSADTTFEFIIYKGDTVEFDDHSAKTVAEKLKEKGVDFMYTALEVKSGESKSKELSLEKFETFEYTTEGGFKKTGTENEWDPKETYHIVELDSNENYRYRSTNKAVENNYSFKIDPIRNTPLNFVNENMISAPVELPSAGGKGVRMFIFGGLIMICLSTFFLMRNKRKHTKI